MSIALLTLFFSACQKETISELKNEELKTNNIAPPPGGTITLQTVVVRSRIDISFGWENNGSFQVHNVRSGIGGGGGGASWQQGLSYVANDPNNPDVINMILIGTYSYLSGSTKGAWNVTQVIQIKIIYNTRTGVKSTVVSTTNSSFTR